MPLPYLQKLSKEKNIPLKELEDKWEEAKKLAEKGGHKDDYAYIMAIFKKLVGVKESLLKIISNKIKGK